MKYLSYKYLLPYVKNFTMDIVILLSLAAGIIIILVVLTVFSKKVKRESIQEVHPERAAQGAPGARRRILAGNRNLRGRQQIAVEGNGDDDNEVQYDAPTSDVPEGKVGAKKLAKLQAKAEKKAMREAEEKSREEKKKAQELADEQRRILEEKEREEERKREEKERKEREEKEKQEYEEYLKLKQAFSVQEEGFEEGEEDTENTFMDFLNYIKDNKVVVLEDIAAKFNLKTQSAIDRIQQLQLDGLLTGVIDDRGKFIFISAEELGAVAKFVKQRGRVSIAELVENSNQLINLVPKIEVTQ